MADLPTPGFQTLWSHQIESLRVEYRKTIVKHPDAGSVMEKVHLVLKDIASLAGCTPKSVGESEPWKNVITKAAETRRNLRQILQGKQLYSALHGVYSEVLADLKIVLQQSASKVEDNQTNEPGAQEDFREQRRRKRKPSDGKVSAKKVATTTDGVNDLHIRPQAEVTTRNYYAPLRSNEMEVTENTNPAESQQAPTTERSRPPPIVLTTETNLIRLQKDIKGIIKGSFEFRSTRNGTRVVMREMADFSAIRSHFESNNLHYFTFHPKSQKPIKAVIRHLPFNTPAEDISDGLVSLGFDVISVKQMTSTRRPSAEGASQINLPLFLVTLPRNQKSQDIFKITGLCHISIKVEAYKAQTGLTQCYNCQKFGHVWANCRQPPRCLWCGGGHLHKECPEKGNNTSKPTCCNCKLAEGENPHPSNYRGCSHAKEEMRKRKDQRAPKPPTGRVFSSTYATPGVSYAAALQNSTQPRQASKPIAARVEQPRLPAPAQQSPQQPTGQSVQAASVNSASLDNMFRVASVVQQIMTGLNDAVSEEQKIVAITKIVMKLMNSNGC
jgi:hypothetical protein